MCNNLHTIELSGNNLVYVGNNVFYKSLLKTFYAQKRQLEILNYKVGSKSISGKNNVSVVILTDDLRK